MPTIIKACEDLVTRCGEIQKQLQDLNFEPDAIKRLNKYYNFTEVTKIVNRTRQTIDKAELEGRGPKPDRDPESNRRLGYRLEQIHELQELFKTRPTRRKDDETIILAMQNFKGGVGKSTLSCHCAQYLAYKGYRVLVIDCDSQASTTSTFGYIPDLQIAPEDTLLPYLEGLEQSIDYAIRPTYWDGCDLIPSNLTLYTAEYYLAATAKQSPNQRLVYEWLPHGIKQIADKYDVIILDPPPALGMISLNVLQSVNALIVPMPPGMYDFQSTAQFFDMLTQVLEHMGDREIHFIRILASRIDANKSAQAAMLDLMYRVFDTYIMEAVFPDSAEIQSAANRMSTVYELDKPVTSRKVHKRCLTALNRVNHEIEQLIRQSWPSHRKALLTDIQEA